MLAKTPPMYGTKPAEEDDDRQRAGERDAEEGQEDEGGHGVDGGDRAPVPRMYPPARPHRVLAGRSGSGRAATRAGRAGRRPSPSGRRAGSRTSGTGRASRSSRCSRSRRRWRSPRPPTQAWTCDDDRVDGRGELGRRRRSWPCRRRAWRRRPGRSGPARRAMGRRARRMSASATITTRDGERAGRRPTPWPGPSRAPERSCSGPSVATAITPKRIDSGDGREVDRERRRSRARARR